MKSFFRTIFIAAGLAVLAAPGSAQQDKLRPIVLRVGNDMTAFAADGSSHIELGDFWAPSWGTDDSRIVTFVPNGDFLYPAIFERTGEVHYLFPKPPMGNFLYRPIWSPDDRLIALIRYSQTGFDFVVVDVETAEITAQGPIPEKFIAGFPFFTAGVDAFAWSPDSKKVVLSWAGVLVFDVETETVHTASDQFGLAFWPPDSGGICILQYEREGPKPVVLGHLRRFELATGEVRDIATPEDLANAGIDRAKWLLTGTILLSPDGTSVALSMGDRDSDKDAIRIFDASENCVHDLNQPRQIIATDLVAVMDWAPDASALVVIEEVMTPRLTFGFEARIIDLETQDRMTLTGFELEGVEVDILGLIGILAWSR